MEGVAEITMERNRRAPTKLEKISFGLGDFANNGMFSFVSTYAMFYYTDIAKVSLEAVAAILLIGRMVDAISSVIMGVVIDKANFKMGKCRPFLLTGILPACILMVFIFAIPESFSPTGKMLMAVAAYSMYSVLYAYMNVPYTAMLNVLTDDNEQRVSFNLYKNVGANAGGIFVTATALSIVKKFEEGRSQGYFGAAIVFGIIFLAVGLMCAFFTKERAKMGARSSLRLKESVQVIASNKPWLILCGIQFVSLMYLLVRNQATIYYAKYYLGNEQISSLMLSIAPLASLLTTLILPKIVRYTGIKKCMVYGHMVWAISMIATALSGKSVMGVVLSHVLASLSWGIASGMVFVALTQTIDYGEWKTGKRPQGLSTSLIAFVQKAGIACSGVICSEMLDWGGYVANQELTDTAVFSVKMIFWGIPLILSLITLILLIFYKLDDIYPTVEKELRERGGEHE